MYTRRDGGKQNIMGYFKGWYFKCCTKGETIAFIPSFQRSNRQKTASLQIITDHEVYNLPFDSLEYCEKPLSVKIGNCVFGEKGILLNIQEKDLNLTGELRFGSATPLRYDIMGPFALVPFMQCKHRVFSMTHSLEGHLTLNGREYDFTDGTGYTEGDWGFSFPKRYIWTQCGFEKESLMLSVADIPILKFHFTGIIGFVFIDGKEYRIATYLGAKVKKTDRNTVTVRQGKYEFTASLLEKNAPPLLAPVNGNMCRTIHESASCKAYYRFSCENSVLREFVSDQAGFEFEFFKEEQPKN